jgi:hypothetical protein
MARQQGDHELTRYKSSLRKLSTNKARHPWRHRNKNKRIPLTPPEKAQRKKDRLLHKINYKAAMQKAQDVMLEEAKKLRELFGGHSVEWYFQEIMQRSHVTKKKRKVTLWNAYLQQEVKRINDGDLIHWYICSSY